MNTLEREFRYYLEHQPELVAKYNGKVIAIGGCEVLGEFDSEAAAVAEVSKSRALGSFIVQRVGPGDSAYSQTFHSRVSFA